MPKLHSPVSTTAYEHIWNKWRPLQSIHRPLEVYKPYTQLAIITCSSKMSKPFEASRYVQDRSPGNARCKNRFDFNGTCIHLIVIPNAWSQTAVVTVVRQILAIHNPIKGA